MSIVRLGSMEAGRLSAACASCIAAAAVLLACGCGSGDRKSLEDERAGPAFEDLSYSVEPTSLELGEARYEARGSVTETVECEGAHLSEAPRTQAGATMTPSRSYYTSFWTVEDCRGATVRLHVLKGSETADVDLRRGIYPDGKPAVEYANDNQNFSDLSFFVSDEYDFFLEKGEVQVTEVGDDEVAGKVKAVLEASQADESPTPGIGIEGAFRVGRGDPDGR